MSNLKNRIFTKKTMVLTIAALVFVLNIVVSNQSKINKNSLDGVVSSAFAEVETIPTPSLPMDMCSIEPDSEDNTDPKQEDKGVINYIISLFE